MIEDDEPMPPLGVAPRVHGREILDEAHGHRFEAEIGDEQHLGRGGARQAVQFGRHDGTHIGIARHMHDPGDVGMGVGHGRSPVTIEIVVGELRDLQDVVDFRSGGMSLTGSIRTRHVRPVAPRPQSDVMSRPGRRTQVNEKPSWPALCRPTTPTRWFGVGKLARSRFFARFGTLLPSAWVAGTRPARTA